MPCARHARRRQRATDARAAVVEEHAAVDAVEEAGVRALGKLVAVDLDQLAQPFGHVKEVGVARQQRRIRLGRVQPAVRARKAQAERRVVAVEQQRQHVLQMQRRARRDAVDLREQDSGAAPPALRHPQLERRLRHHRRVLGRAQAVHGVVAQLGAHVRVLAPHAPLRTRISDIAAIPPRAHWARVDVGVGALGVDARLLVLAVREEGPVVEANAERVEGLPPLVAQLQLVHGNPPRKVQPRFVKCTGASATELIMQSAICFII